MVQSSTLPSLPPTVLIQEIKWKHFIKQLRNMEVRRERNANVDDVDCLQVSLEYQAHIVNRTVEVETRAMAITPGCLLQSLGEPSKTFTFRCKPISINKRL